MKHDFKPLFSHNKREESGFFSNKSIVRQTDTVSKTALNEECGFCIYDWDHSCLTNSNFPSVSETKTVSPLENSPESIFSARVSSTMV